MKRALLFITISSFLALASLCRADDKRPIAKPEAQPGTQAPVVPMTPQQMPPSPARVTFRNGQLTIVANNSSLGEILRAVHSQTGATVEIPGNPTDRVFGQFGPGPARDVLASLLNGSHFNYILLGSAASPDELERVILTAKSGGAATSGPETPTSASYQTPQPAVNIPTAPVAFRPPAGNVVVSQPESADDDASSDDSADATDDASGDDQSDQGDDSAQSDDQSGDQGDQAAATDQQDQQQPAVKTPEQMLQELQQRQQQVLQQQQQMIQQQGGAVPGAPPTPPGVVPGQMPPH